MNEEKGENKGFVYLMDDPRNVAAVDQWTSVVGTVLRKRMEVVGISLETPDEYRAFMLGAWSGCAFVTRISTERIEDGRVKSPNDHTHLMGVLMQAIFSHIDANMERLGMDRPWKDCDCGDHEDEGKDDHHGDN